MKAFTNELFSITPPQISNVVKEPLAAYTPIPGKNGTVLNYLLYPEPYYGDPDICSVVLLTHNPGKSTCKWKGIKSEFATRIQNSRQPEEVYNEMATNLTFPNNDTNDWVRSRNSDLQTHFKGTYDLKHSVFIRDLIPYHSQEFGKIDLSKCTTFLYKHFFNQVIQASFNSELYEKINPNCADNTNLNQPASIIYARGKAWVEPKTGLASIGWKRIGKIYSNCYVFKADLEGLSDFEAFDISLYPQNLSMHSIYIVAITQVLRGKPYGVYRHSNSGFTPISLFEIVTNYNANFDDNDPFYIPKTDEMTAFIKLISDTQKNIPNQGII